MWYLVTYFYTFLRAAKIVARMEQPLKTVIRYAVKSANLAICFAGYANEDAPDVRRKSANLGIMSALYDLASDRSQYDSTIVKQVSDYKEKLLSKAAIAVFDDLMLRKKNKNLENAGLERGIHAIKIIFSEFGQWPGFELYSDQDILDLGIYSQVIDDLMDYKSDSQSDHLNYLKEEGAQKTTENFLQWDYMPYFAKNPYRHILLFGFNRARKMAKHTLSTKYSSNLKIN